MKKILIVGATSGLGLETARCYLNEGWQIGIAGRRESALKDIQSIAPEQIVYEVIDVTSDEAVDALNRLIDKMGGMDVLLLSSGIGSQNLDLIPNIELDTVRTNAEGFVRMVTAAYQYFEKQGGGQIAVISSIAGTKGLGAAPSYSATKRFQNTYIDSLAQLSRIKRKNIIFTDIRPGFVETALLKNRSYPLLMKPYYVASKIIKGINRKQRVVVIDWRYRVLVFFWKLIPQWIWERLAIK